MIVLGRDPYRCAAAYPPWSPYGYMPPGDKRPQRKAIYSDHLGDLCLTCHADEDTCTGDKFCKHRLHRLEKQGIKKLTVEEIRAAKRPVFLYVRGNDSHDGRLLHSGVRPDGAVDERGRVYKYKTYGTTWIAFPVKVQL